MGIGYFLCWRQLDYVALNGRATADLQRIWKETVGSQSKSTNSGICMEGRGFAILQEMRRAPYFENQILTIALNTKKHMKPMRVLPVRKQAAVITRNKTHFPHHQTSKRDKRFLFIQTSGEQTAGQQSKRVGPMGRVKACGPPHCLASYSESMEPCVLCAF